MYKYIVSAVIVMSMSVMYSCKHSDDDGHAESKDVAENTSEAGHDSDDIIIEPDVAKRYGIVADTVALLPFVNSVRVTGQLMSSPTDESVVSATTTGVVTLSGGLMLGANVSAGQTVATIKARSATGDDPNRQAKALISSAKREVDRLKPLLDEGLVTMADYNKALAEYESARASFSQSSASGVVKAPRGGTVTEILVATGQFVDTGTPLARISGNSNLLLRADLPEQDAAQAGSFVKAQIRPVGAGDWVSLDDLGARRVDKKDLPLTAGYIPVVFSFRNNGRFSSGSSVEVDLQSGSAQERLAVPESSLVESQGEFYVYVKTGDHEYQKRRVSIGGRSGSSVEILSGLTPGEVLVTQGASVVKMAESSGNVPEGHSHSH